MAKSRKIEIPLIEGILAKLIGRFADGHDHGETANGFHRRNSGTWGSRR